MSDSVEFPVYGQWALTDCGISCLRMIFKYYGFDCSHADLRQAIESGPGGVSLLALSKAAEHFGFEAHGIEATYDRLLSSTALPCIAHCGGNHFVVVSGIDPAAVRIADPARGRVTLTKSEFLATWISRERFSMPCGVLLLVEPTSDIQLNPRS